MKRTLFRFLVSFYSLESKRTGMAAEHPAPNTTISWLNSFDAADLRGLGHQRANVLQPARPQIREVDGARKLFTSSSKALQYKNTKAASRIGHCTLLRAPIGKDGAVGLRQIDLLVSGALSRTSAQPRKNSRPGRKPKYLRTQVRMRRF
jgi:hypothetical protein